MTNISPIEKVVMRRVHTMRVLRLLFSNTSLALVVGVLALYGIGREVWVARVFQNGPQDFFGHAIYFAYAFEHTRFIVQALSLLTLAALIALARETASALVSLLAPSHLSFE